MGNKKPQQPLDDHFLLFASSLEALLAGHEFDSTEDHTARQKRQVETLIDLEIKFRETLIEDWRGPSVYEEFVRFISQVRRNILDARPYFRERQDVFKTEISPALRYKQHENLYKYNINWQFISFALKHGDFSPGSRVVKASNEVNKARQELIEENMPLAVSRARIFSGKTRRAHLTHMDLVQISNEGLIAAVDKFVLPYTPIFRSVVIGRSVGNLIESNSETLLHFYPSDRRKIYRTNKTNRDPESPDWDKCVEAINIDSDEKHLTNVDEVQTLMLAASHVSMDVMTEDDAVSDAVKKVHNSYAADESTRPDVQLENAQIRNKLYSSINGLASAEKKILIMKGLPIT